jgi:hypothetical protein
MNASPDEVAAAISAVERWKASNSMEIVVASMNEQAMIAMEPVGRTLAEAQKAQRLVLPEIVHPQTGAVLRAAVYAPDYATQISATEAVARIVESVKERGPGVQVNVGGQHVHGIGAGKSFEERLRIQREKRGMRDGGPNAMGEVTINANAALALRDGSASDSDGDDGDDEELEDDESMDDEDEGELEDEDEEED